MVLSEAIDNLHVVELEGCEGEFLAYRVENPYKYPWATFGYGFWMDHQVKVIGKMVRACSVCGLANDGHKLSCPNRQGGQMRLSVKESSK